ncbi:MAG: hypothetical protein J2P37_01840 [Ktedonobacteraceae bacterium]|nr:hypothetical protein [Ktedonobacteraceae bacterium]
MESTFRLPFASKQGVPSEKNATLLQIIVVISSGILSSSVIATVLKAWLDNRKTTLTVQVEGDRKKLEYAGHHLNEDAAVIQGVLEKLNENEKVIASTGIVRIDRVYDGQKGEYIVESSNAQSKAIQEKEEETGAAQRSSLLKRLLPGRQQKG